MNVASAVCLLFVLPTSANLTSSSRWTSPSDIQRVSRTRGNSARNTRNHEPSVSDRLQLRRTRNFWGVVQDEHPADGHRCAYICTLVGEADSHRRVTGTKFVLLTSLVEPTVDTVLQKVYEIYADAVMKNPFHTPEMPIRSEGFDTRIAALLG